MMFFRDQRQAHPDNPYGSSETANLEVVPARPPLRSSVSGSCAVAGFKLS
jgi:hypothetical protein